MLNYYLAFRLPQNPQNPESNKETPVIHVLRTVHIISSFSQVLSCNLRVYMYFEFVSLLLLKQCRCYCACDYCAVDCYIQPLWLVLIQ